MKALDGFLLIQRQTTLKVYRPNVRKLHRPRTGMSDGFLLDRVDTTSASLYTYRA